MAQKRKCSANKTNGEPCPNWAMKGGFVCGSHGGQAPQVKAKAIVRYDLEDWGLTDRTEDPGEVLLRLITQSSRRAARYAAELEAMVEGAGGDIQAAFLENTMFGEQLRKMVKLESDERDRCANFATKGIAAGLREREVRIAEQQVSILGDMMGAILKAINPTEEQLELAKTAFKQQVQLVSQTG